MSVGPFTQRESLVMSYLDHFKFTLLGEVPKFGKDRLYSQILDRAKRSEGTMLLILDEAHLLSGDALVDLRLLVSSAVEAGPPLKIFDEEIFRQAAQELQWN